MMREFDSVSRAVFALAGCMVLATACGAPGAERPTAAPGAGTAATGASGTSPTASAPLEVTLLLDWVPNTNHTGIFVAQEKGYFAAAGLKVRIIQPGTTMTQQAVVSGAADFGVDFQEQVTMARSDGVPVVSLAAILQHNTSGFASRAEDGATSPGDWAGMRYGSFGSPFEEPTLRALMTCDGGDFAQLAVVNTGFADPLALLGERQTDLAWIFSGWQGIQARRQGIDLDLVMLAEWLDCIPDYYTPILITSEETIAKRPELVRSFVDAVAQGYAFAIDQPDEAAECLLRAAPEMDRELVMESQAWLSPRYRAEAGRWGEQRREVWDAYARWMFDNGIIKQMIDPDTAFTNAFLP